MSFKRSRCLIPSPYCGDQRNLPGPTSTNRYTHRGTPRECLAIGIGAGRAIERTKDVPSGSLQTIKYVGPVYEALFVSKGISSRGQLIRYARTHTKKELFKLLRFCLSKTNGQLDRRAYNSTLMMLDDSGVENLPICFTIQK